MSQDRRTGQQTVPRDGPLVRGVSRPAVGASQQQLALAVLDTSSSMVGTKIEEANNAVTALATELADPKNRDAFSIATVIYGDEARVQLAPKRATEVRPPEELAAKVGVVGSWTNITAGLTTALGVVEKSLQEKGNWARPVVILLTDGQHNRGPEQELEAIATTLKGKADLLAVAFGEDADLATLQRLATSPQHALRCGNGTELRKFFQTVGRTMSQAARAGGQSVAALLGQGGVLRG